MRGLVATAVLSAAIPPVVFASGSFVQTDWSGGGGVSGPEISFGTTFSTSESICWEGLPGYILLDLNATQHVISADMSGCDAAFPADMDGDGDMDVVAQSHDTMYQEYFVKWFENDGNGLGWTAHIIEENYSLFLCAYPGDLDSDGDMDVVGANANSVHPGVEWWRNEDGLGNEWTRFVVDEVFGKPRFACCADLDGDDSLEIVAASYTHPHEIAWWSSVTVPADSVWEKHLVSETSEDCRELYPTDLDQDGDVDLLATLELDDNAGLSFQENVDGTGLVWSEIVVAGDELPSISVHSADMDGDGDLDVVGCGWDMWAGDYYFYLSWFENEGGCQSWAEHEVQEGEFYLFSPHAVHAADLTRDGMPDIICGEHGHTSDLSVYRSISIGEDMFAEYVLESGPWFDDVDTADFNGDSLPDMLVAASNGIEVRWYDIDCPLQGSLTSSVLDAQGWPEWDSIEWEAVEPAGTSLTFQVRGSNDHEEMGAWSDTIQTSGSLEGYLDSAYRFIQYRVNLQMAEGAPTPYLDQVVFYFSNMGVEEGGEGPPMQVSASPNPFTSAASISVEGVFDPDAVSLEVYDIYGRLLRTLTPDRAGCCRWDGCDNTGREVPAGCYLVLASGPDGAARSRLVKL